MSYERSNNRGQIVGTVLGSRLSNRDVRGLKPDDRRRRAVLLHLDLRRPDGLPLAAQHLGHDRLHRLARHRHLPLPLPQGLRRAGPLARRATLPRHALPARAAVRLRALPGDHARAELPGVHGRRDRLVERRRHLHRHPAVLHHLVRLPLGQRHTHRALGRDARAPRAALTFRHKISL